jgi:zinc/manganese transport system permease protein/iron/zinc/copper transport system permease protein
MGTVIGLALTVLFRSQKFHLEESSIIPLITSFISALLFYTLCETLISYKWPSRNTYYVGIFGLLMAVTYSIISLVPGLETHMAASYFGDLALASNSDSIIMAAIGLIAIFFFKFTWRQVTAWSFDTVIFGIQSQRKSDRTLQVIFVSVSLVTIAASIQLLGFLFTVSCLFLPAMILTRTQKRLRGLKARLVSGSALGVALGFILSLWHGQLPTVPAIGICLLFTSLSMGIRRAR